VQRWTPETLGSSLRSSEGNNYSLRPSDLRYARPRETRFCFPRALVSLALDARVSCDPELLRPSKACARGKHLTPEALGSSPSARPRETRFCFPRALVSLGLDPRVSFLLHETLGSSLRSSEGNTFLLSSDSCFPRA